MTGSSLCALPTLQGALLLRVKQLPSLTHAATLCAYANAGLAGETFRNAASTDRQCAAFLLSPRASLAESRTTQWAAYSSETSTSSATAERLAAASAITEAQQVFLEPRQVCFTAKQAVQAAAKRGATDSTGAT